MHTTARDRLVQVLAGDSAARSDVGTFTLPGDALTLRVRDVGPVAMPVRAAQAKKLIAVARRAKFGLGEETLSDTSVRDTWELTPDQITLGGPKWDAHLGAALAHLRHELGLPAHAQLRAELHSLLIYGKGQFFLPHQDSEKHDDMIATLVVWLPSAHTGGELVVDDGGTDRIFHSPHNELTLIAFYADRRHEVKPVRSGHRITLTFNLMLTEPPTSNADVGQAAQVSRHLAEHFTEPVPHGRDGDDVHEPIRLAFLLDHEYTQVGLQSGRFKGADAAWVAVLRQAAQEVGCETAFALAEVKELRPAIPKGQIPRASGYYAGYGDLWDYGAAGYSDDVADYDLGPLQYSDVTLGWWVRADGSAAEPINLRLDENEVCAATPSGSMTPHAAEFQGWMGNEGRSIERWYRRAAVVIWPKEKSFPARAQAAPEWALTTLQQQIEAGDLDEARSDAASLAPVWRRLEEHLLRPALDVAVGLRDPVAARVVLEPFGLGILAAEHAAGLAALGREYGDPWVAELIGRWAINGHFARVERTTWVVHTLPSLSRALREHDASVLADHIGERAWRWLAARIDICDHSFHGDGRCPEVPDLGLPLARVLEAVSDEAGAPITAALRAQDDDVMGLLIATLQAHRPPSRAAFRAIADDCRDRVARLADVSGRTSDDAAKPWTGCGCELCLRLAEFLASESEHTLKWPLAGPGRKHVLRHIDTAGLPVRHLIWREGRPFTLVLQKT